jgi:5-formyltetrahydrofolate cyclo-ligase
MTIEPNRKNLKSQLRTALRGRRGQVDTALRSQWDRQINQALLEHTQQSRPATVAAFLSFDGEPDLAPALAELDAGGTRLALPVVQELPGKSSITFHAWKPGDPLKPNRYGIAEPDGTDLVPVPELALVLVPLVGWDARGGRLGMGASFYDRLFQPFSGLQEPSRIGVAYELQKTEAIPCDPWDVRLHGVLTENGWFTFGG